MVSVTAFNLAGVKQLPEKWPFSDSNTHTILNSESQMASAFVFYTPAAVANSVTATRVAFRQKQEGGKTHG